MRFHERLSFVARFFLAQAILVISANGAIAQGIQVSESQFPVLLKLHTVDPTVPVTPSDVYVLFNNAQLSGHRSTGSLPAGVQIYSYRLHSNPIENAVMTWEENRVVIPTYLAVTRTIDDPSAREQLDPILSACTEAARKFVKSDPQMSSEQRADRLKALDSRIPELQEQIRVATVLVSAQRVAGPASTVLGAKLKRLRDDKLRFEEEIAAKDARRQAIQAAMQDQQRQAERQQVDDPILQQLRLIVTAREREVQRMLDARQGFSKAEVESGESSVAEAKLRVLEREAQISKAGRGGLLDRLSEELALLAVDVTELQIKLKMVGSQLQSLDPTTLRPQDVAAVIRDNPELSRAGNESQQAMIVQLGKELDDLRKERFVLLVDDVTITRAPEVPER